MLTKSAYIPACAQTKNIEIYIFDLIICREKKQFNFVLSVVN